MDALGILLGVGWPDDGLWRITHGTNSARGAVGNLRRLHPNRDIYVDGRRIDR